MARSIVSIVRDDDPVSAAKKSVEILGGLENAIEKDARVLIKPNLVYGARHETGTTTNLTVLRTLIELIRPITKDISIIESNFGIVPIPESAMPVFKEVAEKVFALYQQFDESKTEEPLVAALPDVKNGVTRDIVRVMDELDIDYKGRKPGTNLTKTVKDGDEIRLKENVVTGDRVPDVRGMGAKDAVFLLESSGLLVRVSGIGKVKTQSLLPGYKFKKGQTISLTLG